MGRFYFDIKTELATAMTLELCSWRITTTVNEVDVCNV